MMGEHRMGEKQYRIVFKGELAYGFELEETRTNLKQLCGYDDVTLDRLFSGEPSTLKSNLSHEMVQKFKAALDRTGAVCIVEEMSAASNRPAPAANTDTVECPKCGMKQDAGMTCIGCGIVFAKYRRMQERKAAMQRGGVPAPSSPPPSTGDTGLQPDEGLITRLAAYFSRHPEQAFILKAFLVIAAIMFMTWYLRGLVFLIVILFPFLFLIYILLKAAVTGQDASEALQEHITFIPVMHTEGEVKKEGTAWTTYTIILINILVFYCFELFVNPEIIVNHLIFIPYKPNVVNVPISLISSMFLHGGHGHLWSNMVALWAVGSVVEKRIGWKKFLAFYFLTGIVADLVPALVDFAFFHRATHGLGASGAIAGVMGLFAIRCYFKSMVFPIPILGFFTLILPINLKIRLNSLVIIGLFFLSDLSGGIGQITGDNVSNIGHWAHIGGMVCGIVLGLMFKLSEGAVEERHQEIGSLALRKGGDLYQAEESLRLALQKNPENGETMILLARLLSKFEPTEEGESLYRKGMDILSRNRLKESAEAFKEYYERYLKGANPATMFRLSSYYHQQNDFEWAARCMELLSDEATTPPNIREKAMFQCARLMEFIGKDDTAMHYYRQFVETFPQSPLHAKVLARINTT
jgi:membrane associated rhomboid family serine protease